MKETLGSRLRAAIEEKQLSLYEVAHAVGVTYESVRQWVSDRSEPRSKRLAQLAKLLDSTEEQLRYGSSPRTSEQSLVPDDGLVHIPVFDAAASMGPGIQAPEYDVVIGGLQLTEQWVHQHLGSISAARNLAVIPAYGDSMAPTFADGDLLLVDRGVSAIRLDAVYVIGLSGELFIKRLQRRLDGSVLMISDNKLYEPYEVGNGQREQLSVLGRVVWAWAGKKL
jgi:phage repressor protein C with HTH and peptisase S24 domain